MRNDTTMPFSLHPDERWLLRASASGNTRAFGQLYTYYYPLLKQSLAYMSGSPEEAHELVHDAFLKVWQTREALTLVKSFRDYVFCIARNKLFDQAKHEKVKQKANAWFRGVEATITAPDEILLLKQYQRLGQEAIDSLSEQKKKIFLLRTQEELKMAEIATIMGISTAAVKKHFYQSVQLVKKYLLNHADWTFVLLGLCDHLVHVARQTAS